jgi:hypothetical protein
MSLRAVVVVVLALLCDLLALAAVESCVGLFLLFSLFVVPAPCFDAAFALADAFVLPLPLPLIFSLVEEVVTLTLSCGMVSIATAAKTLPLLKQEGRI